MLAANLPAGTSAELLPRNVTTLGRDFAFPTAGRHARCKYTFADTSAFRGVVMMLFAIGEANPFAVAAADRKRWCYHDYIDQNRDEQTRSQNISHRFSRLGLYASPNWRRAHMRDASSAITYPILYPTLGAGKCASQNALRSNEFNQAVGPHGTQYPLNISACFSLALAVSILGDVSLTEGSAAD